MSERNRRNIPSHLSDEDAKSLLAALVESSDDVIVSKTLAGVITSWNQAAERMFGYTADEAIGQHITLIIPKRLHPEETMIISKVRNGEPISHYETTRVTKDGREIPLSLTVSPIRNSQGEVIGASKIARDISERRRMEAQRDEFIGVVTHELKTPVTTIKGYTQVLLNRFRRAGDEQSASYLARMDRQLNRLNGLISDLLDVTKLESGKLALRREVFNLNELVMETTELLQLTTEQHRIEVTGSITRQVQGDKDRLGQVLTNYLTNAIKYSPNSERILVQLDTDGDYAVVSVRDFGIGIAKEKQTQLFERFYRVEGLDDSYPGLGLGLYISREIVHRHGGRVWTESEKGKGSTFYFALPLM